MTKKKTTEKSQVETFEDLTQLIVKEVAKSLNNSSIQEAMELVMFEKNKVYEFINSNKLLYLHF